MERRSLFSLVIKPRSAQQQVVESIATNNNNHSRHFDLDLRDEKQIEMANSFLRASRSSFKNVETMTDGLLKDQPLIAIGIFLGLGLMVAYISGFFFLGGYIETWNPAENDAIPYWDYEVLIINRYTGK